MLQTNLAGLYQEYNQAAIYIEKKIVVLKILHAFKESNELELLVEDEFNLYKSYIDTDFKESEYMEDIVNPESVKLGDPIRIYHTDMHSVWIFADGTWFEDGAMLM